MSDDLYTQLNGLNSQIRASHERSIKGWEKSPFYWIRQQPSRRIGAVGEAFARSLLEQHGLIVTSPLSSEHDFVCQGKKTEHKFSTLWEKGKYTFQQFRDQDYDVAMLVGLAPHTAHIWCVPKPVLMAAWQRGDLIGQHGGAAAKETAWLDVQPAAVPAWLAPYGPDPATALRQFVR